MKDLFESLTDWFSQTILPNADNYTRAIVYALLLLFFAFAIVTRFNKKAKWPLIVLLILWGIAMLYILMYVYTYVPVSDYPNTGL